MKTHKTGKTEEKENSDSDWIENLREQQEHNGFNDFLDDEADLS